MDLHIDLPALLDVENAVIGAMLIDFNAVEGFVDVLKDDDFTQKEARTVFVAIRLLQNADRPVNLTTVAAQLTEMKALEEAGGVFYLTEVTTDIGAGAQTEYYVQLLRQQALVRRIVTSCVTIIEDAKAASPDVEGFVGHAMSLMEDACVMETPTAATHIGAVLRECIAEMESIRKSGVIPGVPTGYPCLDRLLGGWKPGEFSIIAARPGVGKSLFALILSIRAAENNVPVAFFSLEMENADYGRRLLMLSTGISTTEMNRPDALTDERMRFLSEAAQVKGKLPIFLKDKSGLTLTELVYEAKRLVRRKHVGLIIVDYLQLINHKDPTLQTREQVVSAISRRLKTLAGELKVPVIALSQVSRQSLRNGTGKPDLSELRESGALEQDTDKVLFILRPESNGAGTEYAGGDIELIVAKNRNGNSGTIKMKVNEKTLYFEDQENDLPEYESVQGAIWDND